MLSPLVRSLVKRGIGAVSRAAERFGRPDTVVVYYYWIDFAAKAEALADLLRRRGFRVEVVTGRSFLTRARIRASRRLHIGFWNKYFMGDLPARYIFYNAEPLSLPQWRNNGEWHEGMRGALQVWGYAANHAKYVAPLGVPYRYVPFGYAPYYEASFAANTAGVPDEPTVDVLFVGGWTARRESVFARLRALGLTLRTVTYENPVRGAELDVLYARAKVVISVFATDDPEAQVVDLARFDRLLSNGRFVLHERPPEANRDLEFEEFVPTVPIGDIADRCAYYVRHDAERARVAADAREWFRTHRSMDASIPYDAVADLTRLTPR